MGRPFYPWQLQDETHAGGVFSALRQKLGFLTPPKEQEVLTFKSRVGSFWAWYAGEAARFRSAINAGKCPGLADEISSTVEKILGFPAWEFGPGADDDSHSFTLTAEGDGHRQLLAMYWLGHAPAIPGWTFYAARQPCANGSTRMEFSGRNFNPIEFWVTPSVDRGREKIDLTVWHPLFDVMGGATGSEVSGRKSERKAADRGLG